MYYSSQYGSAILTIFDIAVFAINRLGARNMFVGVISV